MAHRKRDVQLHFMVSEQEKKLIIEKMKLAGTKNMGAYLRKMAIDSYVIQLELSDLREMISLLRYTSNNLNQLTKKAHETGHIYQEDIVYLHKTYDKLWGAANEIIKRLSSI
ncbi:MAG: plasmid mobilization protein [Mobilitalea sp.]